MIEIASTPARGQVPIIAGTGGRHRARDRVRAARPKRRRERPAAAAALPDRSRARTASPRTCGRCAARVKIGVIVYNRGACRLQPATLERSPTDCPNLVGFKDGIGDIELMVSIRRRLGDRFAYLGGLPTAEVYAPAYRAMGVPGVLVGGVQLHPADRDAVLPRAGRRRHGDRRTACSTSFFLPYLEIRNRGAGYAVSIVKAGATHRRPRRGAGAAAAHRPHRRGIARPRGADRARRRALTAAASAKVSSHGRSRVGRRGDRNRAPSIPTSWGPSPAQRRR